MRNLLCALALVSLSLAGCAMEPVVPETEVSESAETSTPNPLDERISYYAEVYDVPELLIRRSIQRESGFDPAKHAGPYWGLMQIRLATARALGYRGPAAGLLDVDTNLKFAVAYLANAYIVAGGNPNRALALYRGGYYFEARRKRLLDQLRTVQSE